MGGEAAGNQPSGSVKQSFTALVGGEAAGNQLGGIGKAELYRTAGR